MQKLFANNRPPVTDPAILERLAKASTYFQEKLETVLHHALPPLRLDTDNKEIGKKAKDALAELKKETVVKLAAVKSCQTGFSPDLYLRALSAAEIDFKPVKEKKAQSMVEYTSSEVSHPELFAALKAWRAQKAEAAEVPDYQIMHQSVLIQIAAILPGTPAALQKIKGVGKRTVEKYARELLALVADFRQKHEIKDWTPPQPKGAQEAEHLPPKKPGIDTRQASFEMFEKGLTVARIATERGLVMSTIEGHLAFFVETGKLDINRLLPDDKQQAIAQKLATMPDSPFGEIKNALGDNFSYGEIKIMQAYHKYLEKKGCVPG